MVNSEVSRGGEDSESGDASHCKGRRKWSRFPEDGATVAIVFRSERFPAKVVDESFSGIGLEIDTPFIFEIGQRLDIVYRGAPMAGRIRFAIPAEDGRARLGVEWTSIDG